MTTHLQLNLRLSNILLASAAVGNLGGLGNLVLDGIGAEVLESVTLGGVDAHGRIGLDGREPTGNYSSRQHTFPVTTSLHLDRLGTRTEELLGAAGLLNNLNQTRLQLLNRGNVVGEDTHLAGLRGDVDLDDLLRLVDGLFMR